MLWSDVLGIQAIFLYLEVPVRVAVSVPRGQTRSFTKSMQVAPGQIWSVLRLPHLDDLVQINWFRLAAFHQLLFTPWKWQQGVISFPSTALGSECDGIAHVKHKKPTAVQTPSMRAGQERSKRPNSHLPVSMPCKATDWSLSFSGLWNLFLRGVTTVG